MARTARAGGPPPAPPPWHKRYRLLVQLYLLAVLATVAACVTASTTLAGGAPPPAPLPWHKR